MSTPKEIVEAFVEEFIAAWPRRDAAGLARFFSADAVYCNGPMDPIEGREAIAAGLRSFMEMGGRVDVDIVHIVAEGPTVLTERVDHFLGDDGTISLPVMGTFEVRDELITAWRDYFDLEQFRSQLLDLG